MKVQELIDKLNTIVDKNQNVLLWKDGDIDELKEEDVVEFNNRLVLFKDVENYYTNKKNSLDRVEAEILSQKGKRESLWGPNPSNPPNPNP